MLSTYYVQYYFYRTIAEGYIFMKSHSFLFDSWTNIAPSLINLTYIGTYKLHRYLSQTKPILLFFVKTPRLVNTNLFIMLSIILRFTLHTTLDIITSTSIIQHEHKYAVLENLQYRRRSSHNCNTREFKLHSKEN